MLAIDTPVSRHQYFMVEPILCAGALTGAQYRATHELLLSWLRAMQLVLLPLTRSKGIGGTQERSSCSYDRASSWVPETD